MLEGTAPGGQAGTSSKIENYLGFPMGITGQESLTGAEVQAQRFGARLEVSRNAVGLCVVAAATGSVLRKEDLLLPGPL